MAGGLSGARLDEILDRVYAWSQGQGFRGYNKHDGLNSPILRAVCGWGKWPRLLAIQAVMRCPVNPRPLLLVPKTINPKGIALFILGLLDRHRAHPGGGHLAAAEKMLALLEENRSPESWSGACWGYHYPWQDPGFFATPKTPNAVVTAFVCEAFLDAYRVTRRASYLETVASACRFLTRDLTVLESTPDTLCLAYMPLPMTMRVMDVSILIGAVLAQYVRLSNELGYATDAARLVRYVVGQQTAEGAWFYTDPPSASRIRHDNYHTGFILDALWRYMEASGDWTWRDRYETGLRFYAERLFNADGSPRWMSDQDFPHDVHGSAQGLVSFALAAKNGYPHAELLARIGAWAIDHLYHPEGRFFYQERPWYTKRFTLLRWCNAWMFRGISAWRGWMEAER